LAVFNPSVPQTNDPNWLSWSKSITQPKADQSSEAALKGIGDVLSEGVKVTDTGIKEYINDEWNTRSDAVDQQFIKSLQVAENTVKGQTLNILDNQQAPLPLALQNLPDDIKTLTSARANGKISETGYRAARDTIAKDLRSQFPGYRDYIDKITGGTANEYIKSLLGDINSYLTSKDTEKEKDLAFIRQHIQYPGMENVYAKRAAGQMTSAEVTAAVAPVAQQEYAFKIDNLARENRKGTWQEQKDVAEASFTDAVAKDVNNAINTAFVGAGYDQAKISDIVDKWAKGESKPTPGQIEQMDIIINNAKRNIYQLAQKRAVDGGFTKLIGEKVDPIIQGQLKFFDMLSEAMHNDNYGLLFASQRTNKAILENGLNTALTDPDVKDQLIRLNVLDKLAPSYMKEYGKNFLLDDRLNAWINGKKLNALTGGAPTVPGSTIAKPGTFQDHINDARKNGMSIPKTSQEFLKLADQIGKQGTSDPVNENLLNYFFDPKNMKVLENYKIDYVDPVTNKQVPGKYSVYARLTSPDITTTVKRLNNPELTAKYRNWAGNAFGDLFGEEISNLKDYHIPFTEARRVTWNSKTHQLELPPELRDVKAYKNLGPRGAVNRLNWGLRSLAGVADATGGDIEKDLMQFLMASGYNPNPEFPDKMSLPTAILNSIFGSRVKKIYEAE